MGNKGNTLRRKKHYDEYTVMLVGKMGAGKSSLGNFLLQNDVFHAADDLGAVTLNNKCHSTILPNNIKLKIIDTPGFGDFRPADKVRDDLAKAFYEAKDGVDAFLFVISAAERIGRDMVEQFETFGNYMDHEHFFDYVIPVFTKVDEKLKNRKETDIHSYEKQERLIHKELENDQLKVFKHKIIRETQDKWMCISSTCQGDGFYYEMIMKRLFSTIDGIRIQRRGMICSTDFMKKAKDCEEEERAKNKKADQDELRHIVLLLILRMLIEGNSEEFLRIFTDGDEGERKESNQMPGATGTTY